MISFSFSRISISTLDGKIGNGRTCEKPVVRYVGFYFQAESIENFSARGISMSAGLSQGFGENIISFLNYQCHSFRH